MSDRKQPKPTYTAQRRMENGRLAYYLAAADADFWDNQWLQHATKSFYDNAEKGNLYSTLQRILLRYLPEEGKIIEAGCGLGQVVLALQVQGYDIEGVEWGKKTVEAVKGLYPDLPIRTGDVIALDVPNGTYNGYISLGVVEHRYEGPEPFLEEAYRVLRPGGIGLIAVPFMNPLRRFKARRGMYKGNPKGLHFYQYAFTDTEFRTLLEAAGFEIVAQALYSGYKGIKDEIPPLNWLIKQPIIGRLLLTFLVRWSYAENKHGHMLMVVCRKPENA